MHRKFSVIRKVKRKCLANMRKDTVVVGWDQEEFIADVSHYSHISYEFLYKTTILRNLPVIPLNEKI